jgi:hypothetical protein
MAKTATDDKANPTSESKPQPYAPSWVDRFSAGVDRLPGPSWLYYLGLGLVLLLVQAVVLWIEGAFPIGTFLLIHLFVAGAIAFFLALFPYLDNAARTALKTLRPALKASEEEYRRLRHQITTLPARPTLLASLAAVMIIILAQELTGAPSGFEALANSPISAALFRFIHMIEWWIIGAFMYHTVHQLRLINRIYTRRTRINLFRMRPLYAFSSVTALTAVSLTVSTYGWVAINPDLLYKPSGIGITLLILVLAVATFAWPLLGVHRLLVEEKERLLDEISLLLEAEIVELHQRLNGGKREGLDDLSNAIGSLEIEQNVLKGIPTWPWQPETVRLLVTALLLPLGLWIVQVILQRIWGS